jgi:hypothetical protein
MKIIHFYPVARSRRLGIGVALEHRNNCVSILLTGGGVVVMVAVSRVKLTPVSKSRLWVQPNSLSL